MGPHWALRLPVLGLLCAAGLPARAGCESLEKWLHGLVLEAPPLRVLTAGCPLLRLEAGTCTGLVLGPLSVADVSEGAGVRLRYEASGIGLRCNFSANGGKLQVEARLGGGAGLSLVGGGASGSVEVAVDDYLPPGLPGLPLPLGRLRVLRCSVDLGLEELRFIGPRKAVWPFELLSKLVAYSAKRQIPAQLCGALWAFAEGAGSAELRRLAELVSGVMRPPAPEPRPPADAPLVDWGAWPPLQLARALLPSRRGLSEQRAWLRAAGLGAPVDVGLNYHFEGPGGIGCLVRSIRLEGLSNLLEPGLNLSAAGQVVGARAGFGPVRLSLYAEAEVAQGSPAGDPLRLPAEATLDLGSASVSLKVLAMISRPAFSALSVAQLQQPACTASCAGGAGPPNASIRAEQLSVDASGATAQLRLGETPGPLEIDLAELMVTTLSVLARSHGPAVKAIAAGMADAARSALNRAAWSGAGPKLRCPVAGGGETFRLPAVLGLRLEWWACGAVALWAVVAASQAVLLQRRRRLLAAAAPLRGTGSAASAAGTRPPPPPQTAPVLGDPFLVGGAVADGLSNGSSVATWQRVLSGHGADAEGGRVDAARTRQTTESTVDEGVLNVPGSAQEPSVSSFWSAGTLGSASLRLEAALEVLGSLFPCVAVATMGMFAWAALTTGMAVAAVFQVAGQAAPDRWPLAEISLLSAAGSAWSAGAYATFALLAIGVAWPAPRVLLLLLAWCAPARGACLARLCVGHSGLAGTLGLAAPLLLALGAACCALRWQGSTAGLRMQVDAGAPVLVYLAATAVALVLSQIVDGSRGGKAAFRPRGSDGPAACCGLPLHLYAPTHVRWTMWPLSMAVLLLILVGCIAASFQLSLSGAGPSLLADPGELTRPFSLAGLLLHGVREPSDWAAAAAGAWLLGHALVAPAAVQAGLLVLWLAPLRPLPQHRLLEALRFADRWAALDVLVLALAVSCLELDRFSGALVAAGDEATFCGWVQDEVGQECFKAAVDLTGGFGPLLLAAATSRGASRAAFCCCQAAARRRDEALARERAALALGCLVHGGRHADRR